MSNQQSTRVRGLLPGIVLTRIIGISLATTLCVSGPEPGSHANETLHSGDRVRVRRTIAEEPRVSSNLLAFSKHDGGADVGNAIQRTRPGSPSIVPSSILRFVYSCWMPPQPVGARAAGIARFGDQPENARIVTEEAMTIHDGMRQAPLSRLLWLPQHPTRGPFSPVPRSIRSTGRSLAARRSRLAPPKDLRCNKGPSPFAESAQKKPPLLGK